MGDILTPAAFILPFVRWITKVSEVVQEPYLDEVFHVRQAQHYCNGHYDIWDPKITTPPGLYVLSAYLARVWPFTYFQCELNGLRLHSMACMMFIWVALGSIQMAHSNLGPGDTIAGVFGHSRSNIALFPPLFFFCALYYTDVASTLTVLTFYWYFVSSRRRSTSTWIRTPVLVFLGILSLTFRQTNIFWVAVFPAAIELTLEVDKGHQVVKASMYKGTEGFGDSLLSIARTSWKTQALYDPPVRDASIEDYIATVISIVACTGSALTHPERILRLFDVLTPYLVLVATFAGFVAWNGGVVLGDKSNHVATIHLPQMLYIWPYMTFFSWPLVYPYLLLGPLTFVAKLPALVDLEPMLVFRRRYFLPRVRLLVGFALLAAFVVRFNTIVHAFTLADNRHYTFYVFRLLMRPWWIKYAVAPVYIICAWACIQTLGAAPSGAAAKPFAQSNGRKAQESSSSNSSTSKSGNTPKAVTLPNGRSAASVSFVIIWLATTSLQLITAPLVEPRYFILPWLCWRMHLPIRQPTWSPDEQWRVPRSWLAWTKARFWDDYDHRLYLETGWMLLVNAVTGYIFLTWGFEWQHERGKVQRFMW